MTQLSIFQRKSPMELLIEELSAAGDPDGLRWYQRECVNAIHQAHLKHRSVLAVKATGLGKTVTFSALAKHEEGDVLVIAHRDELIRQAQAKIEKMTGEYVDIEQADMVSSPKTHIVVGTVQSLHKRRLQRLGKNRFRRIIVDEAHHATAPSYRRILDFFSDALIDGFTATPDRGDEKALGKVFDHVAYVFDVSEGIAAGYLVPFGDCRRVEVTGFDLDEIKKTAGDLAANELDQAMLRHVEGVVQKTLELEPGRRGVCFFPGVKSAELAAARFNALRPDSAAFVDGFTDPLVRRNIVKRFQQGELQYLCNCQVFTEGFDAPNCDMIVLGRPTLSRSLYAQMVGRGTRVLDGVVDAIPGKGMSAERRAAIAGSAKRDLVVLDFVGNSKKHDLATVVDILGGNYSEPEVRLAKRIAKDAPKTRPADALERARAELKALAKAAHEAKTKVEAQVERYDPFAVLGVRMEDHERFAGHFGGVPATPGQIATLAKFGIEQKDIDQLSKRAAGKLIDKCVGRMQHGLCSFRQLRQLQRFGITKMNVRFDRAKAALDYIAKMGWGAKGPIDHAVVASIVDHRRVAGEEG